MASSGPSTPAGFKETWENIPYVTRHVGVVTVVLFLVFVLNPFLSVLGWLVPGAPIWHVWRYFTAPLSYTGSNFNGLISIFMFCTTLQQMESNIFRSRSRTSYYLLWISLGFDLVGPYLGMYAYLVGLTSAMTYTLAQEAPLDMANYIVFPLQRRYIPLANVIFGFVMSGGAIEGIYEPVCGIVVAHSFLFFTEILPRAGGTSFFSRPPRLLIKLDEMEENRRKRGEYGTGRKLGAEKKWF